MTTRFGLYTWRRAVADVTLMLGLALVVAACSKDLVVDPTFGAACTVGTLREGRSEAGALNEYSCMDKLGLSTPWSAPYEAWNVSLKDGEAYLFRMTATPDPERLGRNGVDAVLALWGKTDGVSVPLTLSDERGESRDAEFFFVAPRSGDFRLVATSVGSIYDAESLGGYTLQFDRCPVLGRLDVGDSGSVHTLRESPCLREAARAANPEGLAYNFFAIRVDSGDVFQVYTEAEDFQPVWEAFDPGFDAFGSLREGRHYYYSVGDRPEFIAPVRSGWMTFAVGALQPTGPSRAFKLHIGRSTLPPKK
ncbi:MAG: hypothetical protein IT357_18280 [Gemmatimonadaceae bacterium]|nr:hypothetical protein [Gemmatimonadaceae bacterium]